MDLFNILGAAAGLDAVYRGKVPRVLPDAPPAVCPFPKWVAPVAYAPALAGAADFAAALLGRLGPEGFAVESRDAGAVTLTRGNVVGDFSVKVAKVRLTCETPAGGVGNGADRAGAGGHVRAEYLIALPLFDTGDLARLLADVREKLERPDPAGAAPADAAG